MTKSDPVQHPLDNPIWNALRSEHRAFAEGNDRAIRYTPDIGPLCGIANESQECFEAITALADPSGMLALFLQTPPEPLAGWSLARSGPLNQMIHSESTNPPLPSHQGLRLLTASDVPEMIDLAELTEPGPFRLRTHELGQFYGIFESGKLAAMAGMRLSLPGFVEVSAVCTHPNSRGKGYAALVTDRVIRHIRSFGKIPFLHTLPENTPAIRVYHNLGFSLRRTLHLAALKYEG